MVDIQLRDYQKECLQLIDNLKSGNHLVHLATGLGKTVIFSHIKRQGRVLILSHRDELVRQPEKYYDCSYGIEQAKQSSKGEEVVSASVQSLVRRLKRFSPTDFDIIITDEAHHSVAPSYLKIYDYFKPRLHLGFTATPNRADKVGLDKVYEDIIYSKDLKWGIEQGYLTDIKCMSVEIGYDISKVRKRKGDFDIKELENAINIETANKGIAKAYKELAQGQTIIFATTVAHAHAIAREIEGAVVVSAETKNREEILKAFTERKIKCIINCMVFTEGTDLPLVETIMIARPTQNTSLYQQMVGRGLRLYEGKKYLTLIDCVGVTEELNVCTAPTLIGVNKEVIPKHSRQKLDGMLSTMEERASMLENIPDVWKINARYVDVFAQENELDTHGIHYFLHSDGRMVCMLGNDSIMVISPKDDLGHTTAKFIHKVRNTKEEIIVSQDKPYQEVLDASYQYLNENCIDSKQLWDMKRIKTWGGNKATDRQIKFIKKLMKSQHYTIDKNISTKNLTKFEATQIINKLLIDKELKV